MVKSLLDCVVKTSFKRRLEHHVPGWPVIRAMCEDTGLARASICTCNPKGISCAALNGKSELEKIRCMTVDDMSGLHGGLRGNILYMNVAAFGPRTGCGIAFHQGSASMHEFNPCRQSHSNFQCQQDMLVPTHLFAVACSDTRWH